MRCTVPTNVPPSEKILKLYDAGRSGGGGITGRPWPGSLHTIRGAPGSLKHVQPALISVLGVKPSAVAAVAIPSETATAAIKSANLIILFSFRRNAAYRRRSNNELPAGLVSIATRVGNRQSLRSGCIREHWRSRRPSFTGPQRLAGPRRARSVESSTGSRSRRRPRFQFPRASRRRPRESARVLPEGRRRLVVWPRRTDRLLRERRAAPVHEPPRSAFALTLSNRGRRLGRDDRSRCGRDRFSAGGQMRVAGVWELSCEA